MAGAHRFGHEILGACLQCFNRLVVSGVAGEDYYRESFAGFLLLFQNPGKLQAIHAGHPYVGDHRVQIRHIADQVQGLRGVVSQNAIDVFGLEALAHFFQNLVFVVDQQDADWIASE